MAICTIEQPVGPMIEATVGLLQERLREEGVGPARNVIVPGSLVVRDSARLPRSGRADKPMRAARRLPGKKTS